MKTITKETGKHTGKSFVLRIIPGERFTPFSLARKLGAHALLESASFRGGRERFSILLADKAFSVFQRNDETYMEKEGKLFKLKKTGKDILDVVSYFAEQHSTAGCCGAETLEADFPVPAGGIGYLSYEYASRFDTIRLPEKEDSTEIPDAYFIFGHVFLIFDHYNDTIALIGLNYREHVIDLERRIAGIESRINDLDFNFMTQEIKKYGAENISPPNEREEFIKGVLMIKDNIVKGNLLQAVLSRRVKFKTDIPALDAYRRSEEHTSELQSH